MSSFFLNVICLVIYAALVFIAYGINALNISIVGDIINSLMSDYISLLCDHWIVGGLQTHFGIVSQTKAAVDGASAHRILLGVTGH